MVVELEGVGNEDVWLLYYCDQTWFKSVISNKYNFFDFVFSNTKSI